MFNEKNFKENLDYTLNNQTYVFKELEFNEIEDNLDKLKNKFKKFEKQYSFLIDVISPVMVNKSSLMFFLETYLANNKLILNIGSGNSNISDEVFNVDIFNYDNVDIVCDIVDLPLKDNTIDVILNFAVLEHVPYPQKVIDEIYRVLKPEGIIYTAFPFMQGFHASPYDFTRVTEEGIKILHSSFEPISIKPFGGPTSGMLWVLQEWLAITFSFGSKKLHLFLYLFFMLLTFPLKFLDLILIKHPLAKNISSGFTYIGKKL